MTHPQDPEQPKPSNSGELKAVEAHIRGMGYERLKYGRTDHKGWRKPSADGKVHMFLDYEQGLDIYRTTQAETDQKVAEAEANLLYELYYAAEKDSLIEKKILGMIEHRGLTKHHVVVSAQLNPQKPKQESGDATTKQ